MKRRNFLAALGVPFLALSCWPKVKNGWRHFLASWDCRPTDVHIDERLTDYYIDLSKVENREKFLDLGDGAELVDEPHVASVWITGDDTIRREDLTPIVDSRKGYL